MGYKMKISKRKLVYIFLQISLLFITMILNGLYKLPIDKHSFVIICKYGTIIILFIILLNYWYFKNLFTAYSIIFFTFCLFQFGVPILYAINDTYKNFYIDNQSMNIIISSAKYSIICIQIFNIGSSFATNNNKFKNDIKKIKINLFENNTVVLSVAKILFIGMGIITIPFAIKLMNLSSIYGYSYVKVDAMGIYNPLINLARAIFIPAGLLWLVYNKNKKVERIIISILLFYTFISMASGGRTEGLALLLVIFYYIINSRENKKLMNNKIFKSIIILCAVVIILFLLTYIAQSRMGNNEKFSILNMIQNTFEEMGFNFTSICFTQQYIPNYSNYQKGLSYIYSIISLIPKSIDPTGIISSINNQLPELWLGRVLQETYGSLYNFGVGYSVIAESYYNFGNYGWIIILIIGFYIQKFLGSNYKTISPFRKYIQLSMLWALMTFSRRSFYSLIKAVEYNILFIIIITWIFYKLIYQNYSKRENQRK